MALKGHRVDIVRSRSGRCMSAQVNGVRLGEVEAIHPAEPRDGIGWVTIRVPLPNCVFDATDPRGGVSEV